MQRTQLTDDQKALLALMYLAGGEVQEFKRLRLGMYALKGHNLHDYEFKDHCPWGPEDGRFRSDLEASGAFINFKVLEDPNKKGVKHRVYELTGGAKTLGELAVYEIRENNPEGYRRLEEVGNLLKQPTDKISVEELYKQFVLENSK